MEIPEYRFPVALIPGGCPQFMDFEIDLSRFDEKHLNFKRYFREEIKKVAGSSEAKHTLHCLDKTPDGDWVDEIFGKSSPDPDYNISSEACLEPFYHTWTPLPILRLKNTDTSQVTFEEGPANWARCYVVRPEPGAATLRLVLMFDTTVEDTPGPDGTRYFALSERDVSVNSHFSLAWQVRDNSWFLQDQSVASARAPWAASWIEAAYRAVFPAKKRDEPGPELKHLACYLTFLDYLHRVLPGDFKVRVINPDRQVPVDVDLILDIGNSRTTGLLLEKLPQTITRFTDSYLLHIRDLTFPWKVYTEPFASRVEFSEAKFGNEAYSRRSGRRTPAFPWASAVRMGPEAAWLATLAQNAEGSTGMSSPKRYLWDERPWQATWRYNSGGQHEPMATSGSFACHLNQEGTPLKAFKDRRFRGIKSFRKQQDMPAFEAKFTRSSMMMFLMGEIIMQALVTINSPGQRASRKLPDVPRRLRRIVFTLPTGMPIIEQRIYRRWVDLAVSTVWEAMGWEKYYRVRPGKDDPIDYRMSPETRSRWDEATCTQLVYLYNEIIGKFQGDAHTFFRVMGKKRPEYPPYHSLRVASIDMGGGTTDLSIVTHTLDNDESSAARVVPNLDFREGFNIAGDDIVRTIITDQIALDLKKALTQAGVRIPDNLMGTLFGKDYSGQAESAKKLRSRFLQQVLVPVALGLLAAYEASDPLSATVHRFRLGQFFDLKTGAIAPPEELLEEPAAGDGPSVEGRPADERLPFQPVQAPSEAVIKYVEEAVARDTGHNGFRLMDITVRMNPAAMEKSIHVTISRVFEALCEVINVYGCDVLLLTGRPSRLFGVINEAVSRLPVPADRIIPMCEYRVGPWYPFFSPAGRIEDPKTTVVVGAILCALAEGTMEGISFNVRGLYMRSNAHFIGEMEKDSRIPAAKVWFEVDVDKSGVYRKEVLMSTPLVVGYRQLPLERWPTTRFYVLDFTTEAGRLEAEQKGWFPLRLGLEFVYTGPDEDHELVTLENDDSAPDEGELTIATIEAAGDDSPPANLITPRLQTLTLDEGYWMDTGIIK